MRSDGGTALIMGASSGIGAAIARSLAATGRHVHLMARRAEELADLATGLHGSWASVDATDPGAVESEVARVVAEHPPTTIGIYASGLLGVASVLDHPLDMWQQTIEVNLNGAFYFARAVAPHLPAGGRLVFISSVSGSKGQPNLAAYAASKGGLNRLAESVAVELEPRGVGVHVVAPGPVATPLLDRPGASRFQLDADQVAEVVTWLVSLPPDVVLRDVVLRAVTSGPFVRDRHSEPPRSVEG